MSSWSIQKSRKYSAISLITEKISLEEWQKYVENDDELIWAENSQISLSFIEAGEEWIKPERFRKQAYFDIRKKDNWPSLRLSYFEGTIAGTTERQTLKRVEKLWDISQTFNSYLFKKGIRFTEDKLNRLRKKAN